MNKTTLKRLIKIVGKEHVLSTPEDLAIYGYDATFEEGSPEVVVLPDSTEQVSQVMKLAHELKLPVITRGMGSGLAAGAVPVQGGTGARTDPYEPHPGDRHRERGRPNSGGRRHCRPANRSGAGGPVLPAGPRQCAAFDHRWEHRLQLGRPALPQIRRHTGLRPGPDSRPGGWARPSDGRARRSRT